MTRPAMTDWLEEALAPLGQIKVGAMFGGFGVSLDGLAFGLVADDLLYLKCDDATEARFVAEGLAPFAYEKAGVMVAQNRRGRYRRAPDAAMDDAEVLREWAGLALAAARRVKRPAGPRRGPRSSLSRPW
ncbi:DNA transformation protein tfoX [Polymorphobacter multimanifer]|uniref:DNA transformation protein n=1 Tax=Polymorphobacter multimanifer TaxID=1070431 RepID=A0A841L833_9SPHN|nr:TfoX/Sxy family protein [Polymorphobacter multimanifer]MBB6229169.1 DNA transformation protein [Polymorphobacter multimanifer]GGI85034.1 DNA transformation protein tfoX [Polymorphobacter multimanifer]